MESDHIESVFRHSSLSPPKDPSSGRSLNQFERPYIYKGEEDTLLRDDRLSKPQIAVQGSNHGGFTRPVTESRTSTTRPGPSDTEDVFDRETRNCDVLLAEVNSLRSQHRSTSHVLCKLLENQKRLNEITATLLMNCKQSYSLSDYPSDNDDTSSIDYSDQFVNEGTNRSLIHNELIKINEVQEVGDDDLTDDMQHHTDNDQTSTSSYEFSTGSSTSNISSKDAFASHGMEMISSMWDNFAVDDYVPSCSFKPAHGDNDGCSKSQPDTWRPRITVPKPFEMTVREEQKEKKPNKAQLEAEREKLKREALEEAEMSKTFRANPVPATTFLPLYEMINAQHEKRRQFVKENSRKILKSKEKPFSFVDRELKRLATRQAELAERLELEQDKLAGDMFKARPIPRHVLDPNVDEKLKEDEEYRSIRIRMRALELLANSHLPNRMRYSDQKYSTGHSHKLKQEELDKGAFLTGEHKFHPAINGRIPDYKQAYEDFQQQMRERKEEDNLLTVTEPFTHRTQSRILERQQAKNAPVQSAHPYREHNGQQDKQQEKNDKDLQLLQREVSRKSIANDVSFTLDVKRDERLKMLRKRDRDNKHSYDKELISMKQRVKKRPLLFERAAMEKKGSKQ